MVINVESAIDSQSRLDECTIYNYTSSFFKQKAAFYIRDTYK